MVNLQDILIMVCYILPDVLSLYGPSSISQAFLTMILSCHSLRAQSFLSGIPTMRFSLLRILVSEERETDVENGI